MDDGFLNLEAVSYDTTKGELILLDQNLLPGKVKFLRINKKEGVFKAIRSLQVRGAPAIGIACAYGAYFAACQIKTEEYDKFYKKFMKAKEYLTSARPTAMNLFAALDRMEACVVKNCQRPIPQILRCLYNEADSIKTEDVRVCQAIGRNGLSLIRELVDKNLERESIGILTHCNAGQLAASKYGTALAPIYMAQNAGCSVKVYAGETRPMLQGARITAFELMQGGVDTTVICDNCAADLMKKGLIQAVLVGCDRVAANGDTANKIGTLGLSVLAKHYSIPFIVCAPSSTIDMSCDSGADIVIEERNPKEVTEMWFKRPVTPQGVKVLNPAFDVTEACYITAIITEYGIAYPPFFQSLPKR